MPTLIMHGEDDQIVPVQISALRFARIISDGKEFVYPGAPHGINETHKAELTEDLLAFVTGLERKEQP